MRVAMTGSTGFIGTSIAAGLRQSGHDVVPVVRAAAQPGQVRWDPASGLLDPADLRGADAVVHLAGAGIGDHRWSTAYKAEILDSRVNGTRLLASALAQLDPRPVLLSGSAVGYYGDRGEEELTEASANGTGFLAEVCQAWEEATGPAADAGCRVVRMRMGVVLGRRGGALKKQLPLFRMGLGGPIGSGRQYLSWIALEDVLGVIQFALAHSELTGPVNVTAPTPVTSAQFGAALGRAVRRPARLPVPKPAMRLVVGREMADEMLLSGQRAVPAALERAGFGFAHPEIDGALRAALDG